MESLDAVWTASEYIWGYDDIFLDDPRSYFISIAIKLLNLVGTRRLFLAILSPESKSLQVYVQIFFAEVDGFSFGRAITRFI